MLDQQDGTDGAQDVGAVTGKRAPHARPSFCWLFLVRARWPAAILSCTLVVLGGLDQSIARAQSVWDFLFDPLACLLPLSAQRT